MFNLKFKIILWEIVCFVLILILDLKLEEDNKLFKDYKLNCMYNYKIIDGIDNRLYSYLFFFVCVFIVGIGIVVGSEEVF